MATETYLILGVVAVILFASRPTIIITGGGTAPYSNPYNNPSQVLSPVLILVFLGAGGLLLWNFYRQHGLSGQPTHGVSLPIVREGVAPVIDGNGSRVVNSNPSMKHRNVEVSGGPLPVAGSRQLPIEKLPSPRPSTPVVLLREFQAGEESKARNLAANFPQRGIELFHAGDGTILAVIRTGDLASAKEELADLKRHLNDLREAGCPAPRIEHLHF